MHRIADLAVSILNTMRQPGRNRYESERQLREWLTGLGITYSSADVGPALTLLASVGLLERPETGLGQPRPGQLPGPGAQKAPETPLVISQARLVIEVCRPGLPGRGERCTRADIEQRLAECDAGISPELLSELIQRLVDVDQLAQSRRWDSAPISYAVGGMGGFDAQDLLESEIGRVMRSRDEDGWEDETELRTWLEAEGVAFDERSLERAVRDLWYIGRFRTHERKGAAKVTEWVPPRIHKG